MRIAFLAYRGNMKSGGQGIYLHALTRELARRGHEIDCFVGPPYPDPMPWARVEEIENQQFWAANFSTDRSAFLPRPDPFRIFRPLNFYEFLVGRFGFLPEPFAFSLRGARAVLRRIREGVCYDLVHDVQSLSYGLLWLRALGLPVVSTVHHPLTVDRYFSLQRDRNFSEYKGTLTFYPIRTQTRVAQRLDAILTCSKISTNAIRTSFRVDTCRIHDVRNGVEFPRPGRARKRPSPPELLFIGRTGDPNKGLEYLLSAMAWLPPEVRLRVLDDFPHGTPLARQIDDPRLRSRIRFDGKVSREALEQAFQQASIVVVPSLFEGFGLPAIEGLSAGTPVVATRAGALPEVLTAVGTGRLVPPADPVGLAKGISETLETWEACQREAVRARARIESLFGWPQVAARTERVYTRVLEQRRPR